MRTSKSLDLPFLEVNRCSPRQITGGARVFSSHMGVMLAICGRAVFHALSYQFLCSHASNLLGALVVRASRYFGISSVLRAQQSRCWPISPLGPLSCPTCFTHAEPEKEEPLKVYKPSLFSMRTLPLNGLQRCCRRRRTVFGSRRTFLHLVGTNDTPITPFLRFGVIILNHTE